MRPMKFVAWASSLLLSGCLSPPGRTSPWTARRVQTPPPGVSSPAPVNPKTAETPSSKPLAPGEKLVPDPIDPPDQSSTESNRTDTKVNKPVEPLNSTPSLTLPASPFKPVEESTDEEKSSATPELNSSSPPKRDPMPLDVARDSAPPAESSTNSAKGRFEALPAPNESPLMLEVSNPKRRPLGSLASFDVFVTNTSDQTMENVVVDVDFDDELAFPGRAEKQFRKSLGIMRPGQSRDLRLSLRGDRVGRPACRFELSADNMTSVKHEAQVEFGEPKLLMKLIGPPRRTVGNRAEFTVRIANISSQPLNDVLVTLRHDGAFSPREATNGYLLDKADRDKHQIRWSLGRLAAGAGVQVQADFDCKQLAEHACVSAQVKCDDQLLEEADRCVTVVSDPGVIDLDVSDRTEPTRVGDDLIFDVRVKNRSLDKLTDLRLDLVPSEHLRLVAIEATLNDKPVTITESKSNGTWRLSVSDSLPPDEVLHLVVRAKGSEPGDADLKVIAMPDSNTKPIESSEFTVINP